MVMGAFGAAAPVRAGSFQHFERTYHSGIKQIVFERTFVFGGAVFEDRSA